MIPRIILLLALAWTLLPVSLSEAYALKPFQEKTVAALVAMPGGNRLPLPAVRQVVAQLSYGQAVVARGLAASGACSDAPDQCLDLLRTLSGRTISFKAAELVGRILAAGKINRTEAVSLLEHTASLSSLALDSLETLFDAGYPLVGRMPRLSATLRSMKPANHWALQRYVAVVGYAQTPVDELAIIRKLSMNSAWALEACAAKAQGDAAGLRPFLSFLQNQKGAAPWAVATLCRTSNQGLPDDLALARSFLLQPQEQRDTLYNAMDEQDRRKIRVLYAKASGWAVTSLNRLHAVTDGIGAEFSDNALWVMPVDELRGLFFELAGNDVAKDLEEEFQQALLQEKRKTLVNLLKKAARRARHAVTKQLTDVELYLLVATGERLYDSSYRDVVAQALLRRRAARSGLIALTRKIDSTGELLGRAMTNLARRGMLYRFMDRSAARQKEFVRAMTAAAFASVDTILDFSVSIERIVPRLFPSARRLFFDRLVAAAATGPLQRRQLLLAVKTFLQKSRAAGVKTPFAAWEKDGRIRALSVFQADDDGVRSFVAFGKKLLARGYQPRPAAGFPVTTSGYYARELAAATKDLSRSKYHLLYLVHRLLYYGGGGIDFVRTVGPVKIVHTLTLNTGADRQKQLLTWYVDEEIEILSQRGHSYWRDSQVLAPLSALLRDRPEIAATLANGVRRFVSLGSCGSMKAFWKTARLFGGRVDILATVGTGAGRMNDQYTISLPEYAAKHPQAGWLQARAALDKVFDRPHGRGYIRPGSLPFFLGRVLTSHSDAREKE